MLKKLSTPFLAFLQASGLVLYILFIDLFFQYVTPQFAANKTNTEVFGPLIMLMLFIISAVISASLVLGRAGVLFWEKHYKQSFTLIGWTVFWCLVYLTIFCTYLVLLD